MRTLIPCLLLVLITSCERPTAPAVPRSAPGAVEQVTAADPLPMVGYFADTLPSADRPGIFTQLWLRSDSTFILRQYDLDRDTLPFGTIGQWQVFNGRISLGLISGKPTLYQPTEEGLRQVDEKGQAGSTGPDMTLDRQADALQEVARMRITGAFTYFADAMSFKPCGASSSWPCAGGEEWTDEGERAGSLNSRELERHYLRSVAQGGDPWIIEVECTLAMGPAMEGDGADEYIFIHRVRKEVRGCL